MTKMRFFKYEGLGNDFILIPQKPCLTPEQIKNYCDRHCGIGADGIIFVYLDTLWSIKIFNSDASIAQQCGNGIRCVAQWLLETGHEASEIKTDSGVKTCKKVGDNWSVDMGIAQIQDNQVSMGNPHRIFLGPVNPSQIDPAVNTEFVDLINSHEIGIRVFERGVGETLACGTGACACVAWLVSKNQLPTNQEITVHLKGGNLYITARPTENGLQVQMKGPARYVFEGEV